MRAFGAGSFARIGALVAVAAFAAVMFGAERAHSAGVVRTWTGNGADSNWTIAANWNPGLPQEDDILVFPAVANRKTNTNNFPAFTIFEEIKVEGSGYVISGNRVTLTAGFRHQPDGGVNKLSLTVGGNGQMRQAGGRLELLAPNAYSGDTVVTSGELFVAHEEALGAFAAKVDIYGGVVTIAAPGSYFHPLDIGGPSTGLVAAADAVWWGEVRMFGFTEFAVEGGHELHMRGKVTGGGQPFKTGGGTLRLSGDNNFTGVVTVQQGMLVAASDTALGLGAHGTVVEPLAVLALDDAVWISGEVLEVNGMLAGLSGVNHADHVVLGDGAEIGAVSGILRLTNGLDQSGPGYTVAKSGQGMVELEGEGNFAGTIEVLDGTLSVRGVLHANVTVIGGELTGDGQTGAVTGQVGWLSPGSGGSGELTINGPLNLAQNMSVDFVVESAAVLTRLRVFGAITLSNPSLFVDGPAVVAQGESATLIVNLSESPVVGTFAFRPEGGGLVVGGTTFALTYKAGPAPANDFALVHPAAGGGGVQPPGNGGAGVDIGVSVAGLGSIAPGVTYTFTVTIKNFSSAPAEPTLVQLLIPTGAAYITANGLVCSHISDGPAGATYHCAVPITPAGAERTVTVVTGITAGAGVDLIFKAHVQPKVGDPPGNNTAEHLVKVAANGFGYRMGLPAISRDGTW